MAILAGKPFPLGTSRQDEGINFAIIAPKATGLSLCLFDTPNQKKPSHEIPFNHKINRTGNCWHLMLDSLPLEAKFYLYRINHSPHLLLDPYAKTVITSNLWSQFSIPYFPLGLIAPSETFDWGKDRPPKIPINKLIIYEMHVRGFTQHHSSQVQKAGTFLGIIEKIPYLKELGINAIELLPIHEFNEKDNPFINPFTLLPLCNYWGYSTVNFFSPMQRYASSEDPMAPIREFKTLVQALHAHKIEIILDVVFNHTAEGGAKGPVYSFKELDASTYYLIKGKNNFLDFTGCGNTVNCNNPITLQLILSCLRYWVEEMHVDGFRFDLASIFKRMSDGIPHSFTPLLESIQKDPVLSKVKLIAEPWDAAGLYEVGSFCLEGGWSEWNGNYRDNVREFIKGTGNKTSFSMSICGSQNLYGGYLPSRSINFVIAHDGFTLNDLVSYNDKHNLINGEKNQDGSNYNASWNCGKEGQTTNKTIANLRKRQMRNFHVALMISRGVPMIHMGDEYGHTKRGNNNSWCQDNHLNWFLWDHLENEAEFYRFYRGLIEFRKENAIFTEDSFYNDEQIVWHGRQLGQCSWENHTDRLIACTIKDKEQKELLFIAFNANAKKTTIELPPNDEEGIWRWVVNTASPPPYDYREKEDRMAVAKTNYSMLGYSSIILLKGGQK